jgi:hypothetical protein
MTQLRNFVPLSSEEREVYARRLAAAEAYGSPRQVWVEDGHVFVEGHDGRIVSMTPEVAIQLGRLISEAGADSLINKIMDGSAHAPDERPASAE